MAFSLNVSVLNDAIKKLSDLKNYTIGQQNSIDAACTLIRNNLGPGEAGSSFAGLIKHVLATAYTVTKHQIMEDNLNKLHDYLVALVKSTQNQDGKQEATNPEPGLHKLKVNPVSHKLNLYDFHGITYAMFLGEQGSKPLPQQFYTRNIEAANTICTAILNSLENIASSIQEVSNRIQEGYHGGSSSNIVESLAGIRKACTDSLIPGLQTTSRALQELNDAVSRAAQQAKNTALDIDNKLSTLDTNTEATREQVTQEPVTGFIHYGSTINDNYQQAWNQLSGVTFEDVQGHSIGPSGGGSSSGPAGHHGSNAAINKPKPEGKGAAGPQKPMSGAGAGMGAGAGAGKPPGGGDPAGDMSGLGDLGSGLGDPSKGLGSLSSPSLGGSHFGGGGGGGGGIGGNSIPQLGAVPSLGGGGGAMGSRKVMGKSYGTRAFGSGGRGGSPVMGMPMGAGGAGAGSAQKKTVQGNSYGKNYGASLLKPQTQVEEELGRKVLGQHTIGAAQQTANKKTTDGTQHTAH